jgi:hypothetical protein
MAFLGFLAMRLRTSAAASRSIDSSSLATIASMSARKLSLGAGDRTRIWFRFEFGEAPVDVGEFGGVPGENSSRFGGGFAELAYRADG